MTRGAGGDIAAGERGDPARSFAAVSSSLSSPLSSSFSGEEEEAGREGGALATAAASAADSAVNPTTTSMSISGMTPSYGRSGSSSRLPAFGNTSAAYNSLSKLAVMSCDTLSASPCHRMPSSPSVGMACISTLGSPTNANHSLSPGGGGIQNRIVPDRCLSLTRSVTGTSTSFFATAPMSLDALFFARDLNLANRSALVPGFEPGSGLSLPSELPPPLPPPVLPSASALLPLPSSASETPVRSFSRIISA
mmetsp:Transcript_3702/g.14949  ORF Transcript_3702/g.14949 Transcript_3702/m.14949 type:complete len:251 (-) Transcript_3702:1474-2226(-)